ncbi:MAG TPA: VOC family protein [Gemmatimonadales bacterium]|jgi:catechol 2,3-dioxygenase-like lactoylglutathione lyase family enzyme|nr:VOC family protein [Gemmatimonadales bacterium]
MPKISMRYIVNDVDPAVAFYTTHLAFHLDLRPDPTFAILSRGDLQLFLSATRGPGGGSQTLPGGRRPEPGGWNRFVLVVDDLEREVERFRRAGLPLRSDIIVGVGGKQILLDDPSGNPIELFEFPPAGSGR